MRRLKRILAARAARARLAQMRGYQRLRQAKATDRVEQIGMALEKVPILPQGARLSQLIRQGLDTPDEKLLRQYLVQRLLRVWVFPEILRQLGSTKPTAFRAPIPAVWRQALRREGVPVDGLACRVMWQACLLALLGFAALDTLRGLVLQRRQGALNLTEAAYFHALGPTQTPRAGTEGPSRDLLTSLSVRPFPWDAVTWFAHGAATTPTLGPQDLSETGCKVPVGRVLAPWSGVTGWRQPLQCLLQGTRLSVASVGWAITGQWWNRLLVHEAMLLAQFRAAPPQGRARAYSFHNSGWVFRPLWTYEAARCGSRVALYFYSTNIGGKDNAGHFLPNNQWGLCTWPLYCVWDDALADFVSIRIGAKETQVIQTGPINFVDGPGRLPPTDAPIVAIFDVQPMRPAIYAPIGLAFDYYRPETAVPFLRQATGAVQAIGRISLLKRKRGHGRSVVHRAYLSEVDRLLEQGALVIADSDLAATRVIERADAVISMPFTSTSVIAHSMGKPACFFDPTGLLAKGDKDGRGLPILHNQHELEEWLTTVLAIAPNKAVLRGTV